MQLVERLIPGEQADVVRVVGVGRPVDPEGRDVPPRVPMPVSWPLAVARLAGPKPLPDVGQPGAPGVVVAVPALVAQPRCSGLRAPDADEVRGGAGAGNRSRGRGDASCPTLGTPVVDARDVERQSLARAARLGAGDWRVQLSREGNSLRQSLTPRVAPGGIRVSLACLPLRHGRTVVGEPAPSSAGPPS